eukprot:4352470-Prymnesium_polylepis.2
MASHATANVRQFHERAAGPVGCRSSTPACADAMTRAPRRLRTGGSCCCSGGCNHAISCVGRFMA